MSVPNRLQQNYSQIQSRTKTFRSSDSRRNNNGNKMQQRGNNNTNRMSINEGSNAKDGSNQGYQRYNRTFTVHQNSSPNSNTEKVANKDFTPNARRGNNRWENPATTYSSVVGSNCQQLPIPIKHNASISPKPTNLVSNPKAISPLLPMPPANVSPETGSGNAVGVAVKPVAAEESVNDSSQATANVSSSHSNNHGQRYSDGYRPRRGNYHGGNNGYSRGGPRLMSKGYSQSRSNTFHRNFGGDHIQTQSYPPVVPVLHSVPYECHVPYADCQACFNSYIHPYPYGIPPFYPQYVLASPVHQNSFHDPSAAASSLPNTPSSTPSDASANSESLAQNAVGNVKVPHNSEKAYQVNSSSFGGTEASQNAGISAVVPNTVTVPRNVTPSMPPSGENLPVTYYPQQVFIPANPGDMQGYVMEPQYINYVNEAGCIITQPVLYCAPNYAPEPSFHNNEL